MSYVVKEKEQNKFVILEKETDVEIEVPYSKKETNDVVRKLNLGSGFNGWTPTFFASRINQATEEA